MSASKLSLEIILLVGSFLSKEDRLACTTVCKSWAEGFTKSLWSVILPTTDEAFKSLCNVLSSKEGQNKDYSYVKELVFPADLKPTIKEVELLQKHFKNLQTIILGCDFEGDNCFNKRIDWKPWSKIKSLTINERYRESSEKMSDLLDVLSLMTDLEDFNLLRPDMYPVSLQDVDAIPDRLPNLKTIMLSCNLAQLHAKDIPYLEKVQRGREVIEICVCVTLIDFRWMYYFLRKYKKFGDFNISFPDDIKRKRLHNDEIIHMIKDAKDEVSKDTTYLVVYERTDGPRLNKLLMESLRKAGVTYSHIAYVTPNEVATYTNGLQLSDFFKNVPKDIKEIRVGLTEMENFVLFSEEMCVFPLLESLEIGTAVCECPDQLLRTCPKLKELDIILPSGCTIDLGLSRSQFPLESLTVNAEFISAENLDFFNKRCGKLTKLDLSGVDLVPYPLSDDGSSVVNISRLHLKSLDLSVKEIFLPLSSIKTYEENCVKLHLICVVSMNGYKAGPVKRNGKSESVLSNDVVTRKWYHMYHSDRQPDSMFYYATYNMRKLKEDEVEFVENYYRNFSKEDIELEGAGDAATLTEDEYFEKENWKDSLERGFLEFRCASVDKFVSPYMTY
ncbi:hypothetical protein F4703DRAFT_1794974 [Phycomyces blakesleeanus]|uniref:F-box domain-containing protein n=1 Tax=Phycomyces blakesleeanus (strain ATCC 8743b / DSM 1359 / FGSC 10004 / NBRC 33097 / NRRL 1555) TaxID=763407 RepID=A0A167N5N2_PHYB8|nr:hypothetical protein PHYBLDRAFT_144414 [Phycomyces blakesleeanus NRRL 1555(-)]OAD75060.1 hypothetical protein PHYBLDRAFT_144414 [Phycomyces blakesleeanus NRRL 1555(-)]|eukprot:XP_018293100.1 hypothetical protein PHYBLDRAFT_144414 [Phycomyces blakesleeanus NRRL 1555(-)]